MVDKDLRYLKDRVFTISVVCQAAGTTQIMSILVQKIANIVVGQMGGPVTDADEMLRKWTFRSYELRNLMNTIILPIGCLDVGLSRHRALLFKVLADKINLPCSLVKGSYYTGTDDGAVNLIKIDNGRYGDHALCCTLAPVCMHVYRIIDVYAMCILLAYACICDT
ncbi:putative non-specific serine/threonine protein kinase [Helianthus annuus]|uniref:Non-specific serine/threonine protein kinase n=1 Tax=Helianthus annuus TaxID=4232 RepID=A0A9K3HF83_HELAN|nr:putative non-specific serine/threonine protein kinase [Helianthus annuus]KAJ0488811.1 putative non-specific serine/threonine protein kinase [Helianthus annuus]KAJ0504654.1 putative non-specific serine/threonine protein kinase [Helianthus annuus]KAJ0674383.1 putative non-specific serine/threonine protein kinase [Helianthus annuus]KAJ0677770.1 putative non-specific serine/threonine protein kinase [Helianthus annuus]